jgi:mannosyltransferase
VSAEAASERLRAHAASRSLRVGLAPVLVLGLAALLRLPTLGQQSLWYDEAYTPVHVLRASLGATLHGVVHSENTPPLWYALEWALTRVLGSGAVELRLLSALAGVATVAVVWAIAAELAGRRAALLAGLLAAANPLLVWYSQEARAYGLFVLMAALAMLCFVRVLRAPSAGRWLLFGTTAALALATHYFAVFLLAPMLVWLAFARFRGASASALAGLALPVLAGAALVPLASAQGGHGTQWIGRWALASRLEAIPQYYLTGYSGAPLGHGVELLVGLLALAGVAYALWRVLDPAEERGALLALVPCACGVLAPVALALLGADYLAPRNLVGAMVPLTVLLGIVIAARRTGLVGLALGGLLALAFAAVTVDAILSPRLQRGDWAGVAKVLRRGHAPGKRAIVTVELGSAPLEYYLPPLRVLSRGSTVAAQEIDEVGYEPLRPGAGRVPAPRFRLIERCNVNGLIVYRFASPQPVTISGQALREQTITSAHPEALVAKED